MNYIGSKYTLLDFLHETIKKVTGYEDGKKYVFADLFAGTGSSTIGAPFFACKITVSASIFQMPELSISSPLYKSRTGDR